MNDEADKAETQLRQLMERGRQTQAEEELAREGKLRQAEASFNARLDSARDLSSVATWRSITPWGNAWVFGLFSLFASLLSLPLAAVAAIPAWVAFALVVSAIVILVASRLGIMRARARTFAFVKGLPFSLEGFEQALSYGPVVPNDTDCPQTRILMLKFSRPGPPGSVVAQTLAGVVMHGARRPYPPLVVTGKGTTYCITLQGGSIFTSQCRWFARSMRNICSALCVMHAVYPVVHLRVEPPQD